MGRALLNGAERERYISAASSRGAAPPGSTPFGFESNSSGLRFSADVPGGRETDRANLCLSRKIIIEPLFYVPYRDT